MMQVSLAFLGQIIVSQGFPIDRCFGHLSSVNKRIILKNQLVLDAIG
jgi:hypothetical protein